MPQSDQIVTARIVLQTQSELQRVGINKAMTLLESTEPDLTEVLLEASTSLFHRVLETGATPRQARRIHQDTLLLLLVCIRSLQKAHAALWQEGTGRDLARQLDPPSDEQPEPS